MAVIEVSHFAASKGYSNSNLGVKLETIFIGVKKSCKSAFVNTAHSGRYT